MGTDADPYRLDRASNREIAAWLRKELLGLGIDVDEPVGRAIRVRGLHYATVGRMKPAFGARRPERYTNTRSDYMWLQTATGAARWLGIVPSRSSMSGTLPRSSDAGRGRTRPDRCTPVHG